LKFAAGTRICREFEVARTVLVVDDDPLVLEVAADMLNDLGCEVVMAASGTDAIGKTRTSNF
jgi:CheY-like chemotaxis protein